MNVFAAASLAVVSSLDNMNDLKCLFILSVLLGHTAAIMNAESYSIKLLTGSNIKPVLPFIAYQRITTFRDYPYLYQGTLEEESAYLNLCSSSPDAVVAVAYSNAEPVGFLTGMSLVVFDEHCPGTIEGFRKEHLDSESCYYLPEIIIVSAHRKQGLARRLFSTIEDYARKKGYKTTSILTENADDLQKPKGYLSQDPLWRKLGYVKSPIMINTDWDTIQLNESVKKQTHTLTFWLKKL